MKKNFCIFLILLILHQNVSVNSQELNCNISINSSAITNVDQSILIICKALSTNL